ncbi:hypothetical protein Tco_0222635 [Tanacetum coccineum]
MYANKKIDLEHPLCPNESKILEKILQNHPLRFSIAASSSVPWIYLGTIFHLPQATNNNDDHFVPAPKFSEMVPFYINDLGFTLELRSPSNFKTTGLVQQWQTLCKMFSRCLTTRVTGYDQPPLLIMQMLYCFVNNIHVDYADLLWEGFHYSLENPTTLIPYPRFTKHIVSHYMTAFPKILRRACDKYHNLDDDEMVKSIFNTGKHKDRVGMKILSWMITDEMKLIENYQMYAAMFGVDVPTTQSQPIESTQGTHRTTSAPRTPNPDITEGESSAPQKATVIRLRIPLRRSTRLTPPTPIPTSDEANDIILQDTIQLKEIEKLVEGTENVEENVEVDSSTLRQNDNQNDPGTRLEPRSNKESPEVEITAAVQPVNVNKEEEES